jgi:flagellar protein FlaG
MIVQPLPTVSTNAVSGTSSSSVSGNGASAASAGNAVPTPTSAVSSAPVTQTASQPKQPTVEELQKAVSNLQSKVQTLAPSVKFAIDQSSGRVVVQVIDSNTNKVIRQIPSEEMIQIDQELGKMQGLLVNNQA